MNRRGAYNGLFTSTANIGKWAMLALIIATLAGTLLSIAKGTTEKSEQQKALEEVCTRQGLGFGGVRDGRYIECTWNETTKDAAEVHEIQMRRTA